MIPVISDSKIWQKSEKLRGFVKGDTIRKSIQKTFKEGSDKTKINPNTFISVFLILGGLLFMYHMYSLWTEDKYKIKDIKSKI